MLASSNDGASSYFGGSNNTHLTANSNATNIKDMFYDSKSVTSNIFKNKSSNNSFKENKSWKFGRKKEKPSKSTKIYMNKSEKSEKSSSSNRSKGG